MEPTIRAGRYRASLPSVLDFAWDAGPFRADNVIEALSLTRSTALSALNQLIEIGLIREVTAAGAGDTRLGRPARRFELRADAGLLVGLDAGGRHFTAVAADLTGRVLAVEHRLLPEGEDEENLDAVQRRAAARRVIDDALAKAGGTRGDVVALGIGVPAPVDQHGRSPGAPGGFWRGVNADLHAALAVDFPVVRTENDASLAAVAEGTLGAARGCRHYVAMLSGRRLGAGAVVDGHLMRGANGGVGELEALRHVDGVGGTWGLGLLAEQWVQRHVADGTIAAPHPWARLHGDGLTAEAIFDTADPDEPVAARFISEMGEILGLACNMLARFYDPELIVICGAMAPALDGVVQVARAHLAADLELPPPSLVGSELGGDVVSLGALCAAREAARNIALPLFDERRRTAPPKPASA